MQDALGAGTSSHASSTKDMSTGSLASMPLPPCHASEGEGRGSDKHARHRWCQKQASAAETRPQAKQRQHACHPPATARNASSCVVRRVERPGNC